MTRQKRYITFYQLKWNYCIPYLKSYGLCCTKSWWKCFKMGMRHFHQGKATFFKIEKACPKQDLHSH